MRLIPLLAVLALGAGSCMGFDSRWGVVFPATRISTPQGLSASASLVPADPITGTVFYRVEPGTSAGKVAVGYVAGDIEDMFKMHAVMITVMRTWGDPLDSLAADQTYVGLEYERTHGGLSLMGGVFIRTSRDAPGDGDAFSAGVGFGF